MAVISKARSTRTDKKQNSRTTGGGDVGSGACRFTGPKVDQNIRVNAGPKRERKKRTSRPRVLSASVPILAVEAEGKQIPVDVKGNARGGTHSDGRGEKKSDDGR